ncbi:MAG: hypothetical protein NTX38_00695 [Methylobacter sp.]|nr:hypothetical protein [Methylobacter sp.]
MNKLRAFIRAFHMRPSALRRAKKTADRLHKKNGYRYRVFFILGRYRVMDRNDIRDRKKSGLFNFWLKAGKDFDTVAIYDTNSYPENGR